MGRETHYYALRLDTPAGAQILRVGEEVDNLWGLSADTLPLLHRGGGGDPAGLRGCSPPG